MNHLSLQRMARRIRHSTILRRSDRLWAFLRPLYHRCLDPLGRGVPVCLGDHTVCLPAALLGTYPDWSDYETETFRTLANWLVKHPGKALLLDIGCSVGVVSSFALQLSPTLRVIAFDSDATSLKAMESVVPRHAQARFDRVWGLLGSNHESGHTFAGAVRATLSSLPDISPRAAIMQATYVCFGDTPASSIPKHRLDDLLSPMVDPGHVLLKCDVEGAELLVLSGARETLARFRPTLLISVHPAHLPRFGKNTGHVADFLTAAGYEWRIMDRDHEEHWLATPRP